MYGSLLNDVSYMVAGGSYPLDDKSAIGFGYVGASTADILLTSATGATVGSASWGNSVMFVSYGTYLDKLPAFSNVGRDVLVGASLKYYSVGGAGTAAIARASGSGFGLDLGALFPATDYLTLGANYQNVLGGSVTKGNGLTESFNSNIKLGAKVDLMGKGTALYEHDTQKLYGAIDYDISTNGGDNVPHLGLEFWPHYNLAFRLGSDNGEVTTGVGLRFSGVEFNLAFHPYGGISDDSTYFFSLSYLGEPKPRQLKLKLSQGIDKTITHAGSLLIEGEIEIVEGDEGAPKSDLLQLTLDGKEVPVNEDNTFQVEVPLDFIGKKLFALEAKDSTGLTSKRNVRVVRLIEFDDVPEGYWAKQPIDDSGTVKLVQGYPDGTFRPETSLSRAELATLLVRAKGVKLPARQARKVFKDVSPKSWAAKYIEIAYMAGLLKGYPDGTFKPNNKVTRAEGITLLARFDKLEVTEITEKPYIDVATKHWAAPYISAAKAKGMLKFIVEEKVRPRQSLGRAETIEILAKTVLAGRKIEDLYSWDKGFKKTFKISAVTPK